MSLRARHPSSASPHLSGLHVHVLAAGDTDQMNMECQQANSFRRGTPVEAWIGGAWTSCIYDDIIAEPTASYASKKRKDEQRLRDRGAHFVRRTHTSPREFAPDGGVRAVGESASVPKVRLATQYKPAGPFAPPR